MRYFILIISACLLFITACSVKNNPEIDIPDAEDRPSVVAYLPTWKMPYTPDWEKITHLCIAFGIVEADGSLNLTEVNKHRGIVHIAQGHGVKVLLSIGGGGTRNFSSAILDKNNRNLLIDNLDKAIKDYGFDGIDIDYEEWEGGPEGRGSSDIARQDALEKLYRDLRERVGDSKLITAAVAADWDNGTWGYYNCYNNSMHGYLDFVSLMIYDETGPWEGAAVGQHAGWDFFENSINFWLSERKLPKEKLIAGVPFYGYRFKSETSTQGAESISYKDILINYPGVDTHLRDDIGLLFYNGITTIKRKAGYIQNNKLGGIMIWEITHDTNDKEKSLLNTIYEVFGE